MVKQKSKMKKIFKCQKCGEYTMQTEHCNTKTTDVRPAKYSPEDKYGKYRREVKKQQLKEEGII